MIWTRSGHSWLYFFTELFNVNRSLLRFTGNFFPEISSFSILVLLFLFFFQWNASQNEKFKCQIPITIIDSVTTKRMHFISRVLFKNMSPFRACFLFYVRVVQFVWWCLTPLCCCSVFSFLRSVLSFVLCRLSFEIYGSWLPLWFLQFCFLL